MPEPIIINYFMKWYLWLYVMTIKSSSLWKWSSKDEEILLFIKLSCMIAITKCCHLEVVVSKLILLVCKVVNIYSHARLLCCLHWISSVISSSWDHKVAVTRHNCLRYTNLHEILEKKITWTSYGPCGSAMYAEFSTGRCCSLWASSSSLVSQPVKNHKGCKERNFFISSSLKDWWVQHTSTISHHSSLPHTTSREWALYFIHERAPYHVSLKISSAT